jgi:LPXTG-motif cell wall-anchored protein
VQNTVNLWFAGKLPNPVPKAVEFADATVGQHYLDNNPGSQLILRDGNLYIATAESSRWPDSFVRMAETGIGVLSLALFGGALAIGGWVYYRRRKRRMGLGGIDTVRRIARENGCSNIAGLRR